ncbi:MAG: Fe-S cluster assembly protein SufD [Bacteroidales bacterium]
MIHEWKEKIRLAAASAIEDIEKKQGLNKNKLQKTHNNTDLQDIIKKTSQQALSNVLAMDADKLITPHQRGLFPSENQFLQKVVSESFTNRHWVVGSTASNIPNFHCDVENLHSYPIFIHNACVFGSTNKNLLIENVSKTKSQTNSSNTKDFEENIRENFSNNPAPDLLKNEKIKLDRELVVCKISDLSQDPENVKKLRPFFDPFEESSIDQCRDCGISHPSGSNTCSKTDVFSANLIKSNIHKPKSTIDFAKGCHCREIEEQKWLNKALETDGLVIYVPAHKKTDKPLQIINLCDLSDPSFLQTRLWVLLEEESSLTLVQCIDSDAHTNVFVNSLTEVRIGKNAALEFLSLQNVNNQCSLYNTLDADLQEGAKINTFFMSLNGGEISNNQEVNLLEKEAEANLFGLYLVDKQQMVYNHVRVNHKNEKTRSRQLFKGVLDDSASGFFKGHVFVAPQAQKTEAYQNNRNLLLTSKAQFQAKPYLEIYADDVKCSHGATVGQLDKNALFYMRCRGISESHARRLLMYAYTDEIISKISVEALRKRFSLLVKRRFDGELTACDQCSLHCDDPCDKPLNKTK